MKMSCVKREAHPVQTGLLLVCLEAVETHTHTHTEVSVGLTSLSLPQKLGHQPVTTAVRPHVDQHVN